MEIVDRRSRSSPSACWPSAGSSTGCRCSSPSCPRVPRAPRTEPGGSTMRPTTSSRMASSKAVEYGIAIVVPAAVRPVLALRPGRHAAAAPVARRRPPRRRGHGRVVPDGARRRVPPGPRVGARAAARHRRWSAPTTSRRSSSGTSSASTCRPRATELRQGEPAWRFIVDGRQVDMVSPVTGTVTAVNRDGRRATRDS